MRKVFIGLLAFFSVALIGVIGYIFYSTSQQDGTGTGNNSSSTSSSTTFSSTTTSVTSSSTSSIDIPVADEDPLSCGASGSDIVVDFEDLTAADDGTNISNQYADLGFSFRNGERYRANTGESDGACNVATPVVATKGAPTQAFAPNDRLGSAYSDRQGDYFITDTGVIGGTPCQLIIDFSKPTFEFSFDLYDVDNSESWLVEAFDQVGNLVDSVVVGVGGSGKPQAVSLQASESIVQIVLSANSNYGMNTGIGSGSGWGLAFDNFRPYCVAEPPTPMELTKNSNSVNIVNGQAQIEYTVTVTNPGDEAVTDIIVTDDLASYISDVESISNGGTLSGSTITWNIASMDAGQSLELTYTALADVEDLPQDSGIATVENTARVYVDDNGDGVPDESEEDDEETEITEINLDADAQVVKSVSASEDASGNTVANYTVRITNTGDAAITGYTLQDIYDSSVQESWISNISNGGVLSGGAITWSDITIPLGSSLSLTYTITIPAGTEITLQNVATLYDENDEVVDEDGETILVGNDLPNTGIFDDSRTIGLFLIGLSLIMFGVLANRINAEFGLNFFRPYEDRILSTKSKK